MAYIEPSKETRLSSFKVRFKQCIHGFCSLCSNVKCYREGNYDIDGWRYDDILGHPVDMIEDNRIVTKQLVTLRLEHCDFYTMEPPSEGIQPIL